MSAADHLPVAGWRSPAGLAMLPLMLVASGPYTVLPGSGYLLWFLSLSLLLANSRFRATPGCYWQARQLMGLLIFNAVFLIYGVSHGLEGRTYVLHLFTLSMFLISVACSRLAFGDTLRTTQRRAGWGFLDLLAVSGLLLLLLGQLAQSAGWLPDVEARAGSVTASLVFRPGGFHNANMTAALALIFLLLPGLHVQRHFGLRGVVLLALAAVVVGLTQSRAGLLALALYGIWLFRRQPGRVALLLSAFALAGVVSGGWDKGAVLLDLLQRFGGRFGGDASSTERVWVLRMALRSIQEAPLFGQGYGFLFDRFGVGGSHNQIVEQLVAFGVVGGLATLCAGALLLWPASAMLVLVGVLPTLIFSHNYFESASFQVALGMALAADQLGNAAKPVPSPHSDARAHDGP